jgi:hypothetical protein
MTNSRIEDIINCAGLTAKDCKDSMNNYYYKMIVYKCAQTVDSIHIWNGSLGNRIRN